MKTIYHYFAILSLALIIPSCSHNSVDDIYGGRTPEPSGTKQEVTISVNNFTGEYTKVSLEEAKIKLIEYYCFYKTSESLNTFTLYSKKSFPINSDTKNITIKDSLPVGTYKINVLASTQNFTEENEWDGKTTSSFLFDPGYKDGIASNGILPGYENCAWIYRYDNDVFSKIIDLEVSANQSGINQTVTLSRLIGKVEVTVENLYASALPDSVNYIMCANENIGGDIGKVFSLLDNSWKSYNSRWFNSYYPWGKNTILTRQQVKDMNANGIHSYTFTMNMIEGAGSGIRILGRSGLGAIYPTDIHNIFSIKVNNTNLTVVRNKTLKFKGKLIPDGNTEFPIGDINAEWDGEVDGGGF